jgi:hypothetical protein
VGLPYLGPAPDKGAFEFAAHQIYLPLVPRSATAAAARRLTQRAATLTQV